MTTWRSILNPVVAAFLLLAHPVLAQTPDAEVTELLDQLRNPDLENWQRVERQLFREWSQSGSASADLLLQRGRAALERGDTSAAIDHFSALIDHAPDFAEGWNARATAWFMARNYGLALNDIRETLARNPDHFAALIGLGRILEDLERYDDARRAWDAAAAIHPHRRDVKAALERLDRRLQGTSL
ncbi:tetratricopeptide repeat protein [Roseinatronobacter sp. NSM]|uniref:tetratricopeptide repeat protein n=1 Tax=Roseinatronobacter sp. NSM TaxID=3457785 RepID=UPI004035773E